MLTGLLLGAGASYEVGMPLVWELTEELVGWLTPEVLRDLNRSWRDQGSGYSDQVIDDLAKILIVPGYHYENILGHLETQFLRYSPLSQEYHGLYSWLVSMVYQILYLRHIKNITYVKRTLHYLEGINKLAAKNSPLWIFSLNHDLILECFAAEYNIPLNSGSPSQVITLPCRDEYGRKTGTLKAEVITGDRLENSGIYFLQPGMAGINLLKLHGALDVFTFNEGKDLLKLIPTEASIAGVMDSLRAANENLLWFHPDNPNRPVKVTNEIVYADDNGEVQFLRRTLLAGAFKFNNRKKQILPSHFLSYFRSYIHQVSSLVCIGYSFGDLHVNQTIRDWLEFSVDHRIEIVDPKKRNIPSFLGHLATQVTWTESTATQYLDDAAGIIRSRLENLEKRFDTWSRRSPNRSSKIVELQEFLQKYYRNRNNILIENLSTLPVKQGEIDIESLGITPEEFIHQWSNQDGNKMEDLLEAFLQSRTPKA